MRAKNIYTQQIPRDSLGSGQSQKNNNKLNSVKLNSVKMLTKEKHLLLVNLFSFEEIDQFFINLYILP